MNDTRSKLQTLFKRLTDPATTDLEAMEACIWFRKLKLDAKDVGEALGVQPTPNGPPVALPASLVKPASGTDGPMWPFKRRHAGESIAHIARTDPDYLRYMLRQGLREPLFGNVVAAMGAAGYTITDAQPAQPDNDD